MLRSIWSYAWWSVSSTFDFDVEPYAHFHFCVVARAQDQTAKLYSNVISMWLLRSRSVAWSSSFPVGTVHLFEIFRICLTHHYCSKTLAWMKYRYFVWHDWNIFRFPSSIRNLSYLLFFVAQTMACAQYGFSISALMRLHIIVMVFILSSNYCSTITTGYLQLGIYS